VHVCAPAGVRQFFLCDLDEGQDRFLHEGAEAQAELAGEAAHLAGQRGAQVLDHLQVVRHGRRHVHQVVDVHGVVLRLLNSDLEGHLTSCAGGRRNEMMEDTTLYYIYINICILYIHKDIY